MEQIIAQKEIKRVKPMDEPLLTEACAQMMTFGGSLILATTIILTLVLILSMFFPRGNGLQFVIIIALTIVGWGFFINCATERISIKEGQLVFKSLIGKVVRIDIVNIYSYKLTNLGLRLDGNMYLIEIEHDGKDQPEEIWLSPCWKSKDLTLFCNALGQAMEEAHG